MAVTLFQPQALVFDLMGTCCDWKTSIVSALESCLPSTLQIENIPRFADEWRAGFFKEIHSRFEQGLPSEDIDITHRRVLDELLLDYNVDLTTCDDTIRTKLVRQWHNQQAWPDALAGLAKLMKGLFVVVLANGTTRLQLDITKSAGLQFDMLFSSELLGVTKPDPSAYIKVIDLLKLVPEQCCMVAAHAYDLRAAKDVGMKTVYIQRTTEDLDVDMNAIKLDVTHFIDGRDGTDRCGLSKLANILKL